MSKIHVLNQDTINKIAAGEVIERPMAVVKELTENAIDADATAVTVEVKDGGKALIRMTDNGVGMNKEDIRLAFTPHATSKIEDAKDLLKVATLGFRGEALASISSVSQLEMVTKTRNELMGSRYEADGGVERTLEDVGCPDGTTILVRNLFYNTPARLKFLKSSPTEAGYINTLIERLALSHPEISFRFINQNQTKLHTSGNGNLKDVIYHIYGRDITANLIEVDAGEVSCQVKGFIGKPVVSRGNRNYMNYFINGRYIKSSTIHKAIEDAYQPYTMQHRYPFTVLHFTVNPELVDINVHPQKMEIRFSDAQGIYQSVYHAVSEALKYKEFIPEVTLQENSSERKAGGRNGQQVAFNHRAPGCKPKDLIGIPWLVALALRGDGWYLRSSIIWHKTNPMPESTRDRPTRCYEYVFLLTKSKKHYYNWQAVAEPIAPTTAGRLKSGVSKGNKYNGTVPGQNQPQKINRPREKGAYADELICPVRSRRNVWQINNVAYHGGHFAAYPPKLAETCILAGCPVGGIVLDPFLGSGTTAAAAKHLSRRYIGIELNPDYCTLAKQRIGGDED